MKPIASFTVDHLKLLPGVYVWVARTGAAHLVLPRTFPHHHADPGQSGGLPGEKGSLRHRVRFPLSQYHCVREYHVPDEVDVQLVAVVSGSTAQFCGRTFIR